MFVPIGKDYKGNLWDYCFKQIIRSMYCRMCVVQSLKNKFYSRHIHFFFTGTDCGPQCSQGYGEWYSDYYSQWGNTLSCSNVKSPRVIMNCAPTIVDVL